LTKSGRSRTGTRLDPNVAAALAYVFGPIGGAVFLIVERENGFVRFHALQSIFTFVGIAVLHMVIRNLPVIAWLAVRPLMIMTAILWVFLIIKAFMKERYKLPVIGDLVERQLASRAR
jgi:uncharacterized membrane protein